jgi:hypothetical protein
LIPFAVVQGNIVVGQTTPSFLNLTFELVELALGLILIHDILLFRVKLSLNGVL